MKIGVPKETKDRENRVALTPDVVKDLVRKGYQVAIETGAGVGAYYSDEVYTQAGAELGDKKTVYGADVVLKVNAPNGEEIALMKKGAVLISFMWAATNPDTVKAISAAGISAFSMDAI